MSSQETIFVIQFRNIFIPFVPRVLKMKNFFRTFYIVVKCGLLRWCIQKFPDGVHNEINNKHSLRGNTKGYGGKTH
jgi:hypothetical protein